MSYNLKEIHDNPLKPTPEERKGLLSNFDVDDRDNGEPPHYEDEEYAEPRERAPLRKRRILGIAGGLIALILGASFLAPLSRMCGIGAANRLLDPSKLLSNGTHEFKRTVLMVSIDGLRSVSLYNLYPLSTHAMSDRADYLDRGFTPHLLDISKQGLRAKFMRPAFPVRISSLPYDKVLNYYSRH